MSKHRPSIRWIDLVLHGGRPEIGTGSGDFFLCIAAGLLALALAGCGGSSGGGDASARASIAAPVGVASGPAALAASSTLTMSITGATINSPPVVTFQVTNEGGVGMAGLTAADLRFNIAKLIPGSNGNPATWQNYINRVVGGAVQGSQERSAAGFAFGTLADNGNGTYVYSFATDIKTANPCPAPCTDADGRALDISFQPGATHRVTIHQANGAYPRATGTLDFVPNGGAGAKRDIVANATCNQCHNELTAHGTRVDVKLCVTCHNPGSWVAGAPNVPVDFKVMVHRIHYNNAGAALPSVVAGTQYVISGRDFSKVAFPQDVRSCTKCHDGTAGAANATAHGDNWKTQPSLEACGSCHDNVNFGATPNAAKPVPHPGGVMTDNSTCALCHAAGRFTTKQDIVVAHNFPARFAAATAKFKYNIISATPTTAGANPVITFSVTDPTNANAPYDIKTAAAFTSGANSTLTARFGWSTSEFNNDGRAFGQAVSINLLSAAVTAGAAAGTFTVTSPVAIPAGVTGTLRVLMDGHPAGDVTTAGTFTDKLPVTSVFKDFAITGTATARRLVVDIAKCNVCHGVLSPSAHDKNRNGEPGICVVCHNPNATDATQRPGVAGVDGKLEEATDFKAMIHGIHAGQADKGGFRTKGITLYGANGPHDFSSVVFPGKLNNCTNCHTPTSYLLGGTWAAPTANGILWTTTSTGASATLSTDNLRTSPTAAVCSSCHDSAVAKIHMQDAFNGGLFDVNQATMDAAAEENCSFCHGSGRALDVKTVHGVQ